MSKEKILFEKAKNQIIMMNFFGESLANIINEDLPEGYSCYYNENYEEDILSDALVFKWDTKEMNIAVIVSMNSKNKKPALVILKNVEKLGKNETMRLKLVLIGIAAKFNIPLGKRLKI